MRLKSQAQLKISVCQKRCRGHQWPLCLGEDLCTPLPAAVFVLTTISHPKSLSTQLYLTGPGEPEQGLDQKAHAWWPSSLRERRLEQGRHWEMPRVFILDLDPNKPLPRWDSDTVKYKNQYVWLLRSSPVQTRVVIVSLS